MSDLNDPRVFFAAERTLLAWNRTSLAWMAFGFVIERFGMFARLMGAAADTQVHTRSAFWLGIGFIAAGALIAFISTLQFRQVLKTLKPVEIPDGYRVAVGVLANLWIGFLGLALSVYLFVTSI